MSEPTQAIDSRVPPPRVMAFLGVKGGCGTTTLATNVAAGRAAHARTCLGDLDFYKGDIAGLLALEPTRTMHDLLADPARMDADLARGIALQHESGMAVLPQARDLERAMQVSGDEVQRLLATLRDAFDLVILDVGARLDEPAASAVMRSDLIVLVASPEVAALRDAGRVLDFLGALGVPHDRTRLVVNKVTPGSTRLLAAAEQLGVPYTSTVAWDPVVCGEAELGAKLVHSVDPKARITADIETLWRRLLGIPDPPPPARWSLSRAITDLLSSPGAPARLMR